MITVVIYHEAVQKLVFMKISFIIKIIVNRQTFRYLLILLFMVKIIVLHRNYRCRQNIIVYRQNHRSLWLLVEVLGQYQEFGKPRKLKQYKLSGVGVFRQPRWSAF